MSRVTIDVRDGGGHEAAIELSIRRDTVEAWAGSHCAAVFDREQLRAWLAAPRGFYGVDDMTWGSAGGGEVAVMVDHVVPWWQLAGHVVDGLRERV